MLKALRENLGFILFVVVFITVVSLVIWDTNKDISRYDEKRTYTGIIIEKGYDPPSSGYKSNTDPNYFVIIRDKDINKAIRVDIDIPTYYSLTVGKVTSFSISLRNLNNYNNMSVDKHLK